MSVLLRVLALLSLTTALPSPVAVPSPQTSIVPTGRTYYLKTVSSSPSFSSLYLSTYHTGAGFNDAVLIPATSTTGYNISNYPAATGFLNETQQEFNLGNDFPWGMEPTGDTTYEAWLPVQINVGLGAGGFYFNNTDGTGVEGLKWAAGWPYTLAGNKNNEFQGWLGECSALLACFYIRGKLSSTCLPSSLPASLESHELRRSSSLILHYTRSFQQKSCITNDGGLKLTPDSL